MVLYLRRRDRSRGGDVFIVNGTGFVANQTRCVVQGIAGQLPMSSIYGEVLSSTMMRCRIPQSSLGVSKAEIMVSNNGHDYARTAMFVHYHSKAMVFDVQTARRTHSRWYHPWSCPGLISSTRLPCNATLRACSVGSSLNNRSLRLGSLAPACAAFHRGETMARATHV